MVDFLGCNDSIWGGFVLEDAPKISGQSNWVGNQITILISRLCHRFSNSYNDRFCNTVHIKR